MPFKKLSLVAMIGISKCIATSTPSDFCENQKVEQNRSCKSNHEIEIFSNLQTQGLVKDSQKNSNCNLDGESSQKDLPYISQNNSSMHGRDELTDNSNTSYQSDVQETPYDGNGTDFLDSQTSKSIQGIYQTSEKYKEKISGKDVEKSKSKKIILQKKYPNLYKTNLNTSNISLASNELSQESSIPFCIDSIDLLKDTYDVFLIDIVGVIHDGKNPFEHSIQVINNLVKQKKVVLVSNTPRPREEPAKILAPMGLDPNIPIFTAGDQVRHVLRDEYKNEKIYHLGADRNQDILRDLEIQTTSTLDQANVVLLTQYVDEHESLAEFDALLQEIATRKLIVLCANADKTASVGDKLRYCAGTLGSRIEDFKGIVRYYGKPNTDFFQKILQEIPNIQNVPKNRILIIGDTLEKDIKWGVSNGVDSLLVLTGTTAQDIQRIGEKTDEALKKICMREKLRPTYYIDSIL